MILLAGFPKDACLALVANRLDALNAPYVWFDQGMLSKCQLDWKWDSGITKGILEINGKSCDLSSVRSVYSRLEETSNVKLVYRYFNRGEQSRIAAINNSFSRWIE